VGAREEILRENDVGLYLGLLAIGSGVDDRSGEVSWARRAGSTSRRTRGHCCLAYEEDFEANLSAPVVAS
jgi:hypothetical protein